MPEILNTLFPNQGDRIQRLREQIKGRIAEEVNANVDLFDNENRPTPKLRKTGLGRRLAVTSAKGNQPAVDKDTEITSPGPIEDEPETDGEPSEGSSGSL